MQMKNFLFKLVWSGARCDKKVLALTLFRQN